ncbi:MAG: alpha/beta fold hydrolase [Saprospiraceae bacterium]|nr:alpha/beta fold hydrolase [Saprospiraceae bacterium]
MSASTIIQTSNRVEDHLSEYPFQSHFVNLDGHNIHYIDEGRGDVLLFSHAAIGWSFMYRNMIKPLSKHFRCIALDYPDFGLSEARLNYKASVSNQAQLLSSFVKKLNLNDLTIIGHDTGGPSAFYAATKWSERIRGLILTDTIIYPVSEYPRINTMLRLLGSDVIYWINRSTNFLTRVTIRFGFSTHNLSHVARRIYLDKSATKRRRDQVLNMLVSLRKSYDLLASIANSFESQWRDLPVLLMYGANDPVYKMGIPSRLYNQLTNVRLKVIPGEGHFPHEGQAQSMADEIIAWNKTK